MRLFMQKSLIRRVASLALGMSIALAHASAYSEPSIALDSLPAADTSVATIGMISTVSSSTVGSVHTAEEMSKAKADINAKKAAEEAARKAAEQAAAKKAEEARKATLAYKPTYGRTVVYSSAYSVTDAIKANGKLLGNFKLTFYCPDEACSGPYGNSTASGARTTEGRTIAVDRRVIPLGSKVYIEGYGDFIAEDVGGAIKGNKIDIFLNDHGRTVSMGVKHANVYIMN